MEVVVVMVVVMVVVQLVSRVEKFSNMASSLGT